MDVSVNMELSLMNQSEDDDIILEDRKREEVAQTNKHNEHMDYVLP